MTSAGGDNGLSSIVILGLIDRLYPGTNLAGDERADEGDSTIGLGSRFGMENSFCPIDLNMPFRTGHGTYLLELPPTGGVGDLERRLLLSSLCDIMDCGFYHK